MPNVITLTGPSGCGKTTAVTYFLGLRASGWNPLVIPKYTTRAPRADDGEELLFVKEIPPECDLVYEQYGVRYGVAIRNIFEALAKGRTAILVINDVRAVEDIRFALGGLVRSVFVFRDSPDMERFQEIARKRRVADQNIVQTRFRKAQAIYRIYIENIHLFDHVLINWGPRTNLRSQVRQVLKGLRRDAIHWPLQEPWEK